MKEPRRKMVEVIRDRYSLDAPEVFSAMLQIPREQFIPRLYRHIAYEDAAVRIGHGQTISQPYTVAFMTDLLGLKGKERVLEIGTGSGYQAAILSLLAEKVFSIEIIDALARKAKKRLEELGYKNIKVRAGSGECGWKEEAPFDAILITAGVGYVPKELFRQLKDGGVLVAPVGGGENKVMIRYTKKGKRTKKEEFGIFHFVPFIKE